MIEDPIHEPGEVVEVGDEKKLVRLDLGCGQNRPDGWVGVDICPGEKVDIVHDLTQAPWPFEDESIEEARCSHFFEHLTPEQRILFMNELYRILGKGKGAIFSTPLGYDRQVQDFSHKWPPVVVPTYYYFNEEFLKGNHLEHYRTLYGIKCDFDVRPLNASVTPEFANRNEEHKMFALRQYTNAALDLVVLMVKK